MGVLTPEAALSNMLDKNTTSSTIKQTIDSWYYTNIEQKGYTSYLEDTVWCNDRSVYSLGPFDHENWNISNYSFGLLYGVNDNLWNAIEEGFETGPVFQHGVYRIMTESGFNEMFKCNRPVDRFTTDPENGNGELDYPVGLLTFDEMIMTSFATFSDISNSFLYTGNSYWSGTPDTAYNVVAYPGADYDGQVPGLIKIAYGVRPSISLKTGFTLTGEGDGTVENPYKVNY